MRKSGHNVGMTIERLAARIAAAKALRVVHLDDGFGTDLQYYISGSGWINAITVPERSTWGEVHLEENVRQR